jgi:hypothetical protein
MRDFDALSWRLHWTGSRDTWSIAGDYRTRTEAERAIESLKRMSHTAQFKIEFIGRDITHLNEGSKSNLKY